jgi:hypothetical protein
MSTYPIYSSDCISEIMCWLLEAEAEGDFEMAAVYASMLEDEDLLAE